MGTLSLIFLILFGIVSVLLIVIVALQDENDSGLGGVFGGSDSGSLFGAATTSVVTKITAVLAALFLALALVLAILNKSSSRDALLDNTAVEETVTEESSEPWYSN